MNKEPAITVKDLIEKLMKCDPTSLVQITYPDEMLGEYTEEELYVFEVHSLHGSYVTLTADEPLEMGEYRV